MCAMRWQLLPAAFLGSSGATQERTDRRCAACTRNNSVSFSALSPYVRSAAEPNRSAPSSFARWVRGGVAGRGESVKQFMNSTGPGQRMRGRASLAVGLKWRPFPAFPTGGWIADLQVYSLTDGASSSHVFWEYAEQCPLLTAKD